MSYAPVAPDLKTDFDVSNYPAATADWGRPGYEDDWERENADGWGPNFVQGISGEGTGEYNLLITNNKPDGYGGMYFGGQYDASYNQLTGESAHISSNFSNGFVIKTKTTGKSKFTIGDIDTSHNLFTITDENVVELNQDTYGYSMGRLGDIDGDVPMGIDKRGALFRNFGLQTKIDGMYNNIQQNNQDISNINVNLDHLYTDVNVINQDLSGLSSLLNIVAGTSGEVIKLTQWLASATKIQEAFLKTDDNINRVIAYINRLNFGPKMKYISGANPYEAPKISTFDYQFNKNDQNLPPAPYTKRT